MFERILVPLDGSKAGEAALRVVEELVTKLVPAHKVEVILFQSIVALTHWVVAGEASAAVPYTEKEMEYIEKHSMDYLGKAAENLRSKGVAVKTMNGTGKAADEILKAAGQIDADLIAMSTHGRSGLSRLAFGSVTDKILRGSDIPVLMVRAPRETSET